MSDKHRKSVFYLMRLFHNRIKSDLLEKYTNGIDALLDLCSGKGGDIDKWIMQKIKRVDGYDVDSDSIAEANNRLSRKDLEETKITFKVQDLAKQIVPPQEFKYDVVTCMFAFHYMFASERSFRTFMTSVNGNIAEGGLFIGCVFDGVTVREFLKRNFEHPHLKIEAKELPGGLFGNKIGVFIEDSVLAVEMDEYVVDFEFMKVELSKYGFRLLETRLFSDIHKEIPFEMTDIEKTLLHF